MLILKFNKKAPKSSDLSAFNILTLFSVHSSGEMSNFLLEDYDDVMKFINAETQKRKFKL